MQFIGGRISGASPSFSITAENIVDYQYHKVAEVDIKGAHPPALGEASNYSESFAWKNVHSPFNFEPIVEPKYDGHAQYFGHVSNRPDFIKDYHMIGIMRQVDVIIKPNLKCAIFESTKAPGPTEVN